MTGVEYSDDFRSELARSVSADFQSDSSSFFRLSVFMYPNAAKIINDFNKFNPTRHLGGCQDMITARLSESISLSSISHYNIVSGFPEQTVESQGSSVFCERKSSEGERERIKPQERMSVFAGKSLTQIHILMHCPAP